MSTFQRHFPTAARVLLGSVFFVMGFDGFLHFIPLPQAPPAGQAFLGALFASGYVFPVLKTIETAAGLLLLSNRFVALALAMLAPAIVMILGFHIALEPAGLAFALTVLTLELGLAWTYRGAYAGMLKARVAPSSLTGFDTIEAAPRAAMARS
jgi:hypothetical protein